MCDKRDRSITGNYILSRSSLYFNVFWSFTKGFVKGKVKLDGKCFQTCRTRFAVFFPLPSCCVSSLLLKTKIFFPFSKTKYASKCTIFESFSLFHTKTPNQWKYDSITYGACAILVVYDVWHHRIRKPPFSSVHTEMRSRRFLKSPLRSAFLKSLVFGDRFHRIRVDGRRNRK